MSAAETKQRIEERRKRDMEKWRAKGKAKLGHVVRTPAKKNKAREQPPAGAHREVRIPEPVRVRAPDWKEIVREVAGGRGVPELRNIDEVDAFLRLVVDEELAKAGIPTYRELTLEPLSTYTDGQSVEEDREEEAGLPAYRTPLTYGFHHTPSELSLESDRTFTTEQSLEWHGTPADEELTLESDRIFTDEQLALEWHGTPADEQPTSRAHIDEPFSPRILAVEPTYEFLSQLEDVKVGLPLGLHDFLLTRDATADDAAASCTVCLSCYEPNECVMVLPCKHEYHKDCILTWLKDSKKCPCCRQGVNEETLLAQFD